LKQLLGFPEIFKWQTIFAAVRFSLSASVCKHGRSNSAHWGEVVAGGYVDNKMVRVYILNKETFVN
jgi:hypothetical protein